MEDRTEKCETILDGLDVHSYDGPAYVRAVTYGNWRVAFLNHGDVFAKPTYLERHLETDEAFVLLEGAATLLIGADRREAVMERNRVYNVRKGVWHQIVTVPGTRCLVIENADTSLENSERTPIDSSK